MRSTVVHLLALCLLGLGLVPAGAASADDLKPTATVTIDQVQVAFLFSGNLGGGVLSFDAKTHEFTIGGLGVGGIGASSIKATGTVYNLKRLEDFAGAYGQARIGYALGTVSDGDLWLQNAKGVYIYLKAERKGLALSFGADAIFISF